MTASSAMVEALIAEVSAIVQIEEHTRQAFRAVPRHLFIPPVGQAFTPEGDHRLIDRDADPDDWWSAVYSDTSVVTQLDDGATDITDITEGAGECTSSASAPSTVADLLRWLDPLSGHRVLEVGTGTGWSAALLTHIVGAGHVTSIEVDRTIADQAAKNLAAAGLHARLIVGDGAEGFPDQAPYDRVHVTCGVRTVPYAWLEQCRPGAVIVLPYCPGFGTGHGLRLVVTPDGSAHGRFPGFASYMMMRSQREPADLPPRDLDAEHRLTTTMDPRTIAFAPPGADLAIAALTGLTSVGGYTEDEEGGLYRLWLSSPADPYSWGTVKWRPHSTDYDIYQAGDRPLWDEVTDAYFRWVSWGKPGRERFGMTVTEEGQRVWLDMPDQVIG
ncbi:methyltransferase domain-containing protein [Nonomuraea sp. NPDC050643]|uniref:methyltransferase domain-containing protein n=1 Tax=Nonomuraea sp. NPDC050643 TaxID=3155660 RepID=UPI0033EA3F26